MTAGSAVAREPAAPSRAPARDRTDVAARERLVRTGFRILVAVVCGLIGWHVFIKVTNLSTSSATGVYTALTSSYVISRFVLAALYRAPADVGHEPSVAIVVPAYNEGAAVARTLHSCLALDYPQDKFEVVVVNDGSTDDTWDQMLRAAAGYRSESVRCVNLGANRGKRAAMVAGVRATSAEVLVFVDSDSVPAPGAVRHLVQGFADPAVGAISGLTYARNAATNLLTRMQATRYYVSFQLLKSAESVLGAVACCSGCFAAYRRTAVMEVLERWEGQRFLGVACTYGDDRALTNMLLRRGWRTLYDTHAEAWTEVPDRYPKFFRQQLRWKKSWVREGPILLSHVWRTRSRAFPFVFAQTAAGLLSPVVLLANLSHPFTGGAAPLVYIVGLYLLSTAYAMVYRSYRADGLWKYTFVGTLFYLAFSPQLLWAIVRIRDARWGTRDLTVPVPQKREQAVA